MTSPEKLLGICAAIIVSLVAGAIAIVLYSYLVLLLSDTVLDKWGLVLLRYLGHWLLPIYSALCGVAVISAPLGAITGLLLRRSSPHFIVLAVVAVTAPYIFMHPQDPSVFTGPFIVGLAMWGSCYVVWRRVRPNNSLKPTR